MWYCLFWVKVLLMDFRELYRYFSLVNVLHFNKKLLKYAVSQGNNMNLLHLFYLALYILCIYITIPTIHFILMWIWIRVRIRNLGSTYGNSGSGSDPFCFLIFLCKRYTQRCFFCYLWAYYSCVGIKQKSNLF